MSRPARIEVIDGVYHVVARGNERKLIYRDNVDRERFLEQLGSTAYRHVWPVLSYCLMGNHYHLLVATPNANLARGMRDLNGVYAQAFNRRHGRDGHLFQGRYRAVLVQADGHLHAAVRYIVRNPLRAGISGRIDEWPWTSHHAISGRTPPGLVAVAELLNLFHEHRPTARKRYLELVTTERDPPPHAHPIIDGDEAFIADQLTHVTHSPDHPRAHLTPTLAPLDRLLATADVAAITTAHRQGYSMRQIATHLDLGVTTIHRRIRSHEHPNGTGKT